MWLKYQPDDSANFPKTNIYNAAHLEMENFASGSFTVLNDSASKVARMEWTMDGLIHNFQLSRADGDDELGVFISDIWQREFRWSRKQQQEKRKDK